MQRKLLSFLICICCARLSAQVPFSTMDSVNINNINAAVLVHGDLWWNPTTEVAHCEFPNGSQKNISFAGALWMSGYDGAGLLHVAAQTYRQTGNDFWPGPLDSSDTLTYAISQSWAKIWKVNRSDIQLFQALTVHDTINTPVDILTWPAVGNTYARGNGGAPLTLYPGNTYAPFVDLNGDGIYEPLEGEYPDVPGDQALWWVFSDNGPAHTQTNGRPLGVEIHAMAYAYSRGTLIDNVVYYDYHIINHSANTYDNFRLGQWADMEIGYYYNDYIGFDSSHRMGICYKGDTCSTCFATTDNPYGNKPPVVGISMVVLPGDVPPTYIPAGSFDYYNNDNSVIGNPSVDTEYDHYLRSKIKDGKHFKDDFFGPGIECNGYDSGLNTNYVFTGDPGNDTTWSECTCGNPPGDRRIVLASNDITLLPSSTNDFVLALITTNLDSLNGCPDVSFDSIKIVADTAWAIYYNPLPPVPAAVNNVAAVNTISVYPDPAHNELYITDTRPQGGAISVTVYNTVGQLMNIATNYSNNNSVLDVSQLVPGMYYIVYRNGNKQQYAKFVKE